MNKQEKSREIDALREALQGAPPVFVLGQVGLTVGQSSVLRKKVRAAGSRYRVVKNRVALRALKDTPLAPLAPHLKGPTAIAWCAKDVAPLAKALDEFMKDHQGLSLKAGLVDGRMLDPQALKALASLPSREVLVARLLGVLNGPLVRLLRVLQEPARTLVATIDQIGKKKQEATPAAAGPDA
jgi:large subunit ribosomal protein L10